MDVKEALTKLRHCAVLANVRGIDYLLKNKIDKIKTSHEKTEIEIFWPFSPLEQLRARGPKKRL